MLRKYLFLGIYFFTTAIINADAPGATTLFSPPLKDGIIGLQFTAYNSEKNQFFFTWLSGASEINYVIYTTNGTIAINQTTIAAGSSGSPSACYNSVDKRYLVTWIAGTVAPNFSILDDNGAVLIGPITINIEADFAINADAMCCYNSINNQYCITWTAQDPISTLSATYFAIVNTNGTLAKDVTQIPNVSGETTSDFTDSFVTYNSQNNEYLFTWQGIAGGSATTVLAIYNADGNPVVAAKIIPQDVPLNTSSHPIFSCYNSINNQYFIAWNSSNLGILNGYFAIYDASGVELVPATQILSPSLTFQAPVCSYNVRNNQYFVSWNDTNTQAICAIFDVNGDVIASEIILPLLGGGEPDSIVFNSFSPQDDKYFITWYAAGNINAYFNIFTTTPPIIIPPSNLIGRHGLNRFANYGEYFNQFEWSPSTSFNLASYKIYSDGVLIATLPASETSYTIHNQPNIPIAYWVQAVTIFGDESSIASITL